MPLSDPTDSPVGAIDLLRLDDSVVSQLQSQVRVHVVEHYTIQRRTDECSSIRLLCLD